MLKHYRAAPRQSAYREHVDEVQQRLLGQLHQLARAYQRAAKPVLKQLAAIEAVLAPSVAIDTSDIPEAGEEWFKKATLTNQEWAIGHAVIRASLALGYDGRMVVYTHDGEKFVVMDGAAALPRDFRHFAEVYQQIDKTIAVKFY